MTDEKSVSRWDRALSHHSAPVTLVMLSDMAFTCMDGTVQLLEQRGIPPGQVFFSRMVMNWITVLSYLLFVDPQSVYDLLKPASYLIWTRSVISAISAAMCYAAVAYVPLSVFMTLYHLRPFPTAFVCWLLLGERSSMIQIIASVISFGAVILVVQPDFLFDHRRPEGDDTAWRTLLGVAFTLGSSFTGALDIVACRKIGNSVDATPMLLSYVTVGCFVGPIVAFTSGTGFITVDRPSSWAMITFLACFAIIAQMTMVLALQRASGTKVAVLGYFQITWAALWQTIVHSNPPNLVQILGMVIIIVAGCWAVMAGSPEDPDGKDEESAVPLTSTRQNRGDGYEPVAIEGTEPISASPDPPTYPLRDSIRTQV